MAEVLACLRRSRETALSQALVAEPGLAAALNRILEARFGPDQQSLTLKEVVESLGRETLPKEVV